MSFDVKRAIFDNKNDDWSVTELYSVVKWGRLFDDAMIQIWWVMATF